MNYDVGAMSPYNQANATIGRFWNILSRTQTVSFPDPSFEWSLLEQLPYVMMTGQTSPWFSTTFILSPDAALRMWREDGAVSKEFVIDYLKEHVWMRNENYVMNYYCVQNFTLTSPEKRQPYLDDPEGKKYWARPYIVVTGGKTNQFIRMSSASIGSPVLIDEWM